MRRTIDKPNALRASTAAGNEAVLIIMMISAVYQSLFEYTLYTAYLLQSKVFIIIPFARESSQNKNSRKS